MQLLTKTTSLEKEADILMDHEYDGIRELDNVLPPWWLWMFYITIFIGVVYFVRYHVIDDWSSFAQYEEEMVIAKAEVDAYLKETGGDINENTAVIVTDAASLDEGKKIFDLNCASCHRTDGGGIIGPDLTDDKWIHGGDINSVFKIIKVGVPEKGMLTWDGKISPTQIQGVASYILVKLKGTNPENPKVYPGDPK